jgi:hypothetical protein
LEIPSVVLKGLGIGPFKVNQLIVFDDDACDKEFSASVDAVGPRVLTKEDIVDEKWSVAPNVVPPVSALLVLLKS